MIDIKNISTHCTRSEFVGTAVLDTIGLVISGIDDTLLETMNVGMKYRCLGLFSSRTGAAGQITAIEGYQGMGWSWKLYCSWGN